MMIGGCVHSDSPVQLFHPCWSPLGQGSSHTPADSCGDINVVLEQNHRLQWLAWIQVALSATLTAVCAVRSTWNRPVHRLESQFFLLSSLTTTQSPGSRLCSCRCAGLGRASFTCLWMAGVFKFDQCQCCRPTKYNFIFTFFSPCEVCFITTFGQLIFLMWCFLSQLLHTWLVDMHNDVNAKALSD